METDGENGTAPTRALTSDWLAGMVRRAGGPRRFFWAMLLGVAAIRLLLIGQFGLSVDESHYAMFARRLAWGYFDHPPMVAFLAASTSWPGAHSFWFRLGPVLCSLLALGLLWRLARALYPDERIAPLALGLFLLLPVHHLLGMALLPDATLNLFWIAGLWAAWRAFETRRWPWWIMTGLLFGGMLLSKYHGVLFPLVLFVYAAWGRETRSWLWNPKPYAAGLIGLAVFSPNILWNARHEWMSYAFQLSRGGSGGAFEMEYLLKAVGGQLAAGSPILFVMLIVAALGVVARGRNAAKPDRFALAACLPVFLFFILIGLFGDILPHWPAVGWYGGALALAAALARAAAKGGAVAARWNRWTRIGAWTALAMNALMIVAIAVPVVPPLYRGARSVSLALHRRIPSLRPLRPYQPKFDITNDLYGWDETARQIEALRAAMPNPDRTFVVCHRFFLSSLIGAHLRPDTVVATFDHRPNQYRLWFDPAAHAGWDALFVDYHARWHQGPERYRPQFERLDPDPPARIEIQRRGETVHVFDVFRYYGFKGEM